MKIRMRSEGHYSKVKDDQVKRKKMKEQYSGLCAKEKGNRWKERKTDNEG